ncbi:hypothetical protein HRbin05_00570 [archaeon HR05]|nr:hypothetical protein HRbin05_00570 [archaeon HR05]
MQRANIFIVEDNRSLKELADNCSRLYNELNYERRQSYIHCKRFEWYPKHLYKKYASMIGSATAQQIIKKNNEAWRSFLALKRLEREGKLPKHISRISMPRYWKLKGRRELRVIVRNDCYRIDDDEEYIYLPKGLKLKYKGKLRYKGNQGRLEILYDTIDKVWRGFMSVKVEKHLLRGGSNSNDNNNNNDKPLYIDLGVVNLATVWFNGLRQPIAYSGRAILADWWYLSNRIAREQSRVAKVNNKAKTSRSISRLYRIRQRRFRHSINAMVKKIVEDAYMLGISRIVIGDIKGIRSNHTSNNSKANSMINNFWSFNYILRRFKDKAEEYGIKVEEVSEYNTSSICPFCKSNGIRKHRGLFYCPTCNKAMNADVVGVLNIANRDNNSKDGSKTNQIHIIPSSWRSSRSRDNRLVAQPLLLRWDGMKWDTKRYMNNRLMNTLEARISRL